MSRRGGYPTAELYEERERDFYARPRPERNYEDLDAELEITRSRYEREPVRRPAETVVSDRRSVRAGPGRQPDFLREDYGRTTAGALVIREREREFDEYSERGGPARTVRSSRPETVVEKEKTVIEEDRQSWRPPPRRDDRGYREVEKEEIIYRRGEREPERPRAREVTETDLVIRRSESEAPPRPREVREYEREEIRFRRGEGERRPPPREQEVEKEKIVYRERRSPPLPPPMREREEIKEEIIYRDRAPVREREEIKEEVIYRDRERSRGPPPDRYGPIAREREEFIFRRRESPPRARETEHEEIIIRRREREPSPEPEPPPREPSPEPIPQLPPVVRPPIVQEIITHHRHIDHGVERARTATPPPPPPSPPPPRAREDNLEIEIRRKRRDEDGKTVFNEDIIFERDVVERKARDRSRETNRRRSLSAATTRRRSPSPVRRQYEDDIAAEADFYNRRVASRGYIGEAYNGATKDWAIVDVPPGTERVQMDGIGGASQEVTWQRYNGVRRSKFKTRDQVYESDFGAGNGFGGGREEEREEQRSVRDGGRGEDSRTEITRTTTRKVERDDKMWTEITKDLVLKEAIIERGWEFEETEFFFYVMEYLKYVSSGPPPPTTYISKY